jgi:hypothetical protein
VLSVETSFGMVSNVIYYIGYSYLVDCYIIMRFKFYFWTPSRDGSKVNNWGGDRNKGPPSHNLTHEDTVAKSH